MFLKYSVKFEYLLILFCLNSWKGWSVFLMLLFKFVGLSCVFVSSSIFDLKICVLCFRLILCFRRDLIFRRVIIMGWLFLKVFFVWLCDWFMLRDVFLSFWYFLCIWGFVLICLFWIFLRMWSFDKEVVRFSVIYVCL